MLHLRTVAVAALLYAVAGGCGGAPGEPVCGDGVAEGSEPCDGFDLRGEDCASLGEESGTLRCASYCRFDTSGCNTGVCGDGDQQSGEDCDGSDFGGRDCQAYGFTGGVLQCTADCRADTAQCVGCGDGVWDSSIEDCEGTELGGATCMDLGYNDGALECASDCTFEVSDCERYGRCGDDVVQVMYEECEPWAMEHTCRDLGHWGGTLRCPTCSFVTTDCMQLVSLWAGSDHACGLDSTGTHWCWGRGAEGQLGNLNFGNSPVPVEVAVPSGYTFSQIKTGGSHSCAIDQNGDAWCWGDGADGQLGNNDTDHIWSAPQSVVMPSGRSFVEIALGFMNTCAIDDQGDAWCWGYGNSGEIGNGFTDDVAVPTAVTMPGGVGFEKIDVGSRMVCAVDSQGLAWCWGNSTPCGSGPATTPYASFMPAGRTYQDIRVGGQHTCALDDLGGAWCWGSDQWGQIGNGSDPGSCTAVAVSMPSASFTQIGSGSQHSCGLAPNGTVYCWGRNGYGQLGIGSLAILEAPGAAVAPVSFAQLAVGHSFTCALTDQGIAWCWGMGQYGSIGNASTGDVLSPVETSEP